MNSTPQLHGYQLDQRLLEHPLAEIWRGRSFTGMEVVALILSESGAADAEVRERLGKASRTAALEPGMQQTPLWAANLTADRPYAVTQLVAGQSGAERLLDPLDGLLGNDEESLGSVRSQLAQYGAVAIPGGLLEPAAPAAQEQDEATAEAADRADRETSVDQVLGHSKLGRWGKPVAVLVVLAVFSALYSVGSGIAGATKGQRSAAPTPAAYVEPAALPSPGLLPGIAKPTAAPYLPPVKVPGLVGVTYDSDDDVQQVTGLGLPFVFGWPRPPSTSDLGVSATTLYRRVQAEKVSGGVTLDAKLALRPCATVAACLADRAAFDQDWTSTFKTVAPATVKDATTWLTVTAGTPYTLTMTHVFTSNGRSWLLGVAVTAVPGEEPAAQRVLNDIWRQTQ